MELYNGWMQYISVIAAPGAGVDPSYLDCIVAAAGRCSLVHAVYLVMAESSTEEDHDKCVGLDGLAPAALSDGGFDDMMGEEERKKPRGLTS